MFALVLTISSLQVSLWYSWEFRALKGGEGDAPDRSSQTEPQALHLQAVKFSIHPGAANPSQAVRNVSPAARELRCAGSSDTERSVLPSVPDTSSGTLRDSPRPSRPAPSGRSHSGPSGSSPHAALLSAAKTAPPQPCEPQGEEPRSQNSAISEKSAPRCRGPGRAPPSRRMRAALAGRVWRASGTAAPRGSEGGVRARQRGAGGSRALRAHAGGLAPLPAIEGAMAAP